MPDTDAVPPAAEPASQAPRRPLVLAVDDDAMIRQLIREVLESAGYEVVEAADGAAALDVVAQRAPDLVITDIYMPGMDGFALIDALRKADRRRPIIAITGGGRLDRGPTLALALKHGADLTLAKPFNLLTLIEATRTLLAAPQAS